MGVLAFNAACDSLRGAGRLYNAALRLAGCDVDPGAIMLAAAPIEVGLQRVGAGAAVDFEARVVPHFIRAGTFFFHRIRWAAHWLGIGMAACVVQKRGGVACLNNWNAMCNCPATLLLQGRRRRVGAGPLPPARPKAGWRRCAHLARLNGTAKRGAALQLASSWDLVLFLGGMH